MKTLLATWGTEGDTRPVLALAHGLQQAGHEVTVIADRAGQRLADQLGVPLDPTPGDFQQLMAGDTSTGDMVRGSKPSHVIWPELVRDYARPMADQLIGHLDDGTELFIGSAMVRIASQEIGPRSGIPTLGMDLQPFAATREFPPPLLNMPTVPTWLNLPLYGAMDAAFLAIRKIALARMMPKSPAARRMAMPRIGAWSPTLVPRPREWSKDNPVVMGEFTVPRSDHQPDPELQRFLDAGEPPVFVGLGSMAGVDMRRFRRTAVEALDGRRAIFSAGQNDFTDEQWPDTVMPIGHVPFDWLFPRCSVLVHHGGAGTAHLAARSGRPSVVVPQIADQAFWASQFHKLGIAAAPVNRDAVTAAELRSAIEQADRMLARAQQIQAAMAGEDGVGTAVVWIEQWRARQ